MSLTLVKNAVSEETIATLERLLAEAQAGELVGIAYVVISTSGYSQGFAGDVRQYPIFTRGMLQCLDDELAKLVLPK